MLKRATLDRRETTHSTQAEALVALEREMREPTAKGGDVFPGNDGRWVARSFHAGDINWAPGGPVPSALAITLDIRSEVAEC